MRVVEGRSFPFSDCLKNLFNESELEVASIMLKLSLPVYFSDDETPVKWGATKPRTSSRSQQQQPKVSPSSLLLPCPEVGTSPSSCLSREPVQTPPTTRKEDLGEVSSMYERLKRNSSTQRNIFPVLDNLPEEMEGSSVPVTQQLISESQRVFREQRATKPKRDREESPYVAPTSSKHKYYSFFPQ
ncbi:unnamed protein product [Arabis nemorensis]|uniref:Uncharacterized protein n=1 Tax=Arabis nemorensis TaxID=586526 RepID=A0A565ASR9_9BRAS|nr:unnamed protein product [Arabis nemorensis]